MRRNSYVRPAILILLEAVLEALRRNDSNQTRAAAFLRIPRHPQTCRLEKYGIGKNGAATEMKT